MMFRFRDMEYEAVSVLFHGEVNDCYVAKRIDQGNDTFYSLVVIYDHDTVLRLIKILKDGRASGQNFFECFSNGDDFVVILPYRAGRPLKDFYVGETYTLERCEEICFNLILSCLSSPLDFPILYLILEQELINITRDDSIYFSYEVDLKELDATKSERDCTVKCADILLKLLSSKEKEKSLVYELLSKKVVNKSYNTFTELYRDLRIATAPVKKGNIIQRIKAFFKRNADTLFGILFWICLIIAVVAIILLISNLVVGDIPILRLFYNSFQKIGTESLRK